MKIILIILLFLPIIARTQAYDNLDATSKGAVDSIGNRMNAIKYSKDHHKMVSFSEWSVGGLDDFYSYLIYDLHYYPAGATRAVDIKPTPTGLTTTFEIVPDGYQQKEQKMRIDFTCKKDGTSITQTKITAPFSRLVELYVMYFEGRVREDMPLKGGIDKTYTATDEVKLYDNCIIIKPHRSDFNNN